MIVELAGWAPDRATAENFLMKLDWFETITDHHDITSFIPKTQIQYDPIGPIMRPDAILTQGYHFNLRFYGAKAEALRTNYLVDSSWDYPTWMSDIGIDGSETLTLQTKETTGAKAYIKVGYEGLSGVRFFGVDTITKRNRVWA